MKFIYHKLTLILLVLANNSFAQKVTNIKAEQIGQTIQVSYNLETEYPCAVSLFYSTDNGTSWQGPLKKVSGAVGEKILSGANKITWEVLNEMEQLKFSSVVFKVDARKTGLKEVKIGNQIWSAENLNTDRFADGEEIPIIYSTKGWEQAGLNKLPASCFYNNDSTLGLVYGKLYNWYAVADPRGLCPIGWHVPSEISWVALENTLGGNKIAGGSLKEIGNKHWGYPNYGASNKSGFTGLPGGYRSFDGFFDNNEGLGYWWGKTEESTDKAYFRFLDYEYGDFPMSVLNKGYGFSVRCIKD